MQNQESRGAVSRQTRVAFGIVGAGAVLESVVEIVRRNFSELPGSIGMVLLAAVVLSGREKSRTGWFLIGVAFLLVFGDLILEFAP